MPMWVLLVKSTARRPTRSRTGAICRICRVGNPVAPHRLWLPSRIDTSTSSMVATGSAFRPYQDEDGILVGGLGVVDEELDHFAAHIGMHGVEQLHRLEQADDRIRLDAAADLDVRIRSGLGSAVEGAR